MRERIVTYLLAVTAACMLAALADALVKSPAVRRVARLTGGLLILLTVLTPLTRLGLSELRDAVEQLETGAGFDAAQVQADYQAQWAERVRELMEQNIEQQAASLGMTLRAEVVVRAGECPEPESVTIYGSATAEQETRLRSYLVQTLGFAKERVIWRKRDEGD